MAQLDILGQASGLPLYRLLGGKTRQRVRVYNTTTDYWAINNTRMGANTLEIVAFLLDRGITAMKIYPFDVPDHYLSNAALDRGMSWIRAIRDKVGDAMDICVDCWGRFDLPTPAHRQGAEPYNIMYLEDPLPTNNAQSHAQLARETSVPICASETLATRYEYRELLETKACDVIMYDLTWCGGPSEARKISDLADTYSIPISPHTCGGPLLYICSAHLCLAAFKPLDHGEQLLEVHPPVPVFCQQCPGSRKRPRPTARATRDRRGDQAGAVQDRRRHRRDGGESV